MEELQKELEQLKQSITEQVEAKALEIKSASDENVKAIEEKYNSTLAEMQAKQNELVEKLGASDANDRIDALEMKLQKSTETKNMEQKSFASAFAESIKLNFEEIKSVGKGRSKEIELKAVGNMTVANNLTGDSVATYQNGVVLAPSSIINFRDLIPAVASATGTYVVYRETGSEGGIGVQTAGSSKSQIDYDFTAVTFNADYVAGYARYAKQMAQDLPFLSTALSPMLLRDFFIKENDLYYSALKAVATESSNDKTVPVEKLIYDMGVLKAAKHKVNGILLNPIDWAEISITKPSDYSLPGIVTFANGVLTINGVRVFEADFVTPGEYMIGDWSQAKNVVVDGLKVEFFEQDGDNVTKNLITARVECREVLAIDRPDAFIKGSFEVAA